MSDATPRTPQQVLEELGVRLDAASGRPPSPRLSRRHAGRLAGLILASVAVGVSTAAATTSIFAPAPPLPRLSARAIILASGSLTGEPWELLVSRCDGRPETVTLLLRSATGGAGSTCGPLLQPPTTLYDPRSARALVFGAVPAAAAQVELALGAQRQAVRTTRADSRALAAAALPSATKLYVTTIDRAAQVTAMTAFDRAGQLVLACRVQRCSQP